MFTSWGRCVLIDGTRRGPRWYVGVVDQSRTRQAVGRRARGRTFVGAARSPAYLHRMCRNIHTLHNFEPSATEDEVHAAALQYVRKISGFTTPSQANRDAFDHAVEEIAHLTGHLLEALVTTAPPKDREVVAAKRRALAVQRFGTS